MPVQIYIIIAFVIIAIVFSFFARNSTLAKLVLLPGEEILLEEQGVKISQQGSARQVNFPNCIIRITNLRIIIAQKAALAKNNYVLRLVINYNTFKKEEINIASSLKKGYLNFTMNKSQMTFCDGEKEKQIKIHLPDTALTSGQYIQFVTNKFDEYKMLFT